MRRHQKRQFTIPYERICVASRESSPSCARVPSIFRFRVRARERNNLVQPLVHDYSVATTHNAINGVKLRRKKANRLRCSATGEGQQLTNSNLHRFHTSFLLLRSSRFFFLSTNRSWFETIQLRWVLVPEETVFVFFLFFIYCRRRRAQFKMWTNKKLQLIFFFQRRMKLLTFLCIASWSLNSKSNCYWTLWLKYELFSKTVFQFIMYKYIYRFAY